MPLASGDRLGPYEIVAPVAAGGMGEVYRARDKRLQRDVAVKVLPSAFSSDADRLRRFEQEARALGALNHPNIVGVFDFGEDRGVHYLVSEFLEGQTLRERLGERELPSRKAVEYALQIARALAVAHGKGVVHRDLKPENIFITRDDQVKVLDFGLAKQARAASAEIAGLTATETHTAAGVVMGTAGYMAPEQVRGTATDHRSDIFSFGAILYEMISGVRAFHGSSSIETMNAILKEEPPELPETKLASSPGLERIVRRCLEKAPDRRFQSASDLAFAIEALSNVSTSTAQKTLAAVPARRWPLVALVAVVLTVIAAAGFLGASAWRKAQPVSFKQLVFCPGYISSARFTPDGDSIVYGAAWNGKPIEIYSTRLSGGESRTLGVGPADVLGVSNTGEMAVGIGRHHFFQWMMTGTLGRVALSGGAPRPLLDDVCDADITADGKQFAIVRCGGSEQSLEYPPGNVLFRTSGWIDHPRISPKGDAIAFLDHPVGGDDRGFVALADLSTGKVTRLAGEFSAAKGLAWSAGGDEIWYSASIGVEPNALRGVTRSGRERVVFAAPANLWLQDVRANGKVLLANQRQSTDIAVRWPGQNVDRIVDLEGEDNGVTGISADGKMVALVNSGSNAGTDYDSLLVTASTPAPIKLGEGDPCGITPDGKWVLSFAPAAPSKFTLYPTGTGEARSFDLRPVANTGIYCTWSSDGAKAAFTGAETGKPSRAYLVDLHGGKARPVTPEGTSGAWLSPDGTRIITKAAEGFVIYNVAGGEPQPVKGLVGSETPVQWHASGSKVFVWNGTFPAKVVLLDPVSGERKEWLSIQPPDPEGLLYATLLMTPDGKSYTYRYRRVLSNLFVAEGLR